MRAYIAYDRKQKILGCQSRRSGPIADDLRAKADDQGLKQRSLVKADDLSGAKQTIFELKQTIRDEIGRSHIISKVTDLLLKADDPKHYF